MPTRLIAGVMSGTSADGVDVAVVRVEQDTVEQDTTTGASSPRVTLVAFREMPYPAALRQRVFAARGNPPLGELCLLCRDLSLSWAKAVNETLAAANLAAHDLAAVAVHGQTLYHAPPLTLQLIDPSLIASETGVNVVSDFRRADCAAGGQGAPLVPYADWLLFRDEKVSRVVVNLGGIANVTYLPAGGSLSDVIAFDTGPGNCVSDALCRALDPAGPGYDAGGLRASRGRIDQVLVAHVLRTDFFHAPPPKSTDAPAMIGLFPVAQVAPADLDNALATAVAVSADALLHALATHLPGPIDELVVAGGGVRNVTLMSHLRRGFAGTLRPTDDFGIPGQAREAVAFALLGSATLDHVPGNVPSATGATRGVVLGSITPRNVTVCSKKSSNLQNRQVNG